MSAEKTLKIVKPTAKQLAYVSARARMTGKSESDVLKAAVDAAIREHETTERMFQAELALVTGRDGPVRTFDGNKERGEE